MAERRNHIDTRSKSIIFGNYYFPDIIYTPELFIGGSIIMTNGRKTTFEERVEIVQYCIAHDHNYAETAANYKVSYQQARSYTIKYESGGVEALRDKRGKRKSEDEMTELEKLRAENKILRAEMEASFLKKLAEIERRRG